MIAIRGSVHPLIKPSKLNTFATFFYWRQVPLIADDWYLATHEAGLRWDLLALYHWLREDFGRKPLRDPFGIGFEGSPEEQVVNASLRVTELQSLDELPGDEGFWQAFAKLKHRWEAECERYMRDQEQGQPAPQPELPKPTARAPTPPAQPVSPATAPAVAVPEPTAPAVSTPPSNWKRRLKWLGTAATIAGSTFFLWGLALPPGVKQVVKAILDAIAGAF